MVRHVSQIRSFSRLLHHSLRICDACGVFANDGPRWNHALDTRAIPKLCNETDVIGQFIADHITPLSEGETVDTPVTTGQINNEFQRWKRTNEITKGSTAELKKRLEATYGPHHVARQGTTPARIGWTSFRFETA